ncbi:hypothetical protein EWM64_g7526 [Hericium alpestre]|uniref:Exonuclease domain-containing protein n=1 Tax=Hericium alpestre TaxID=135208 RepID=A0A4Y9ZQE9_9AGAM|nr:hypothetical protein EWM64_g7526 [Hericium alpestre]
MKRSHTTSSPNAGQHAHKKRKTSASVSVGLVQESSQITMSEGAGGGGEWIKVEKRKVKKAMKLEAKLDSTQPRFGYAVKEITRRRDAVGIDDIRDFILHIVADAPPPSWIHVQNPHAVQKVVVLLVPGLTSTVLSLPPLPTSATANPNLPLSIPLPSTSQTDAASAGPSSSAVCTEDAAAAFGGVPFVANTFSHALPTKAPGDATRMHSVLSEFFHGPVSNEEKKRRVLQRIASERATERNPLQYILSVEQMIENDYPIPSYMADVFEKRPGWVETPPPQPSSTDKSTQPKIYAIDCEMCITEDGKALARVCFIDNDTGKVVYDQLVKPPQPIIDYLTRFSGITADVLAPISTALLDVQKRILELLSVTPTPILLGHSLESDLNVLQLCHPRCIDTALLYDHPRGRPLKPGLAWLTKKWCGRTIQANGEGGHDPEEDARACLDLLKKKLENGPSFGTFKTDIESIFERMSRSPGRAGNDSIRSAVIDHGNPGTWHGAKATTPVACKTDEEVVQGVLEAIPNHQFIFGRLTTWQTRSGG